MTVLYKVLGQAAPNANTSTTLYTTPSNTESVVSTIFITNRGTTGGNFSIAIVPSGETLENKHYIAQLFSIESKSFVSITAGITMAEADIIVVEGDTNTLSFSAFGTEII